MVSATKTLKPENLLVLERDGTGRRLLRRLARRTRSRDIDVGRAGASGTRLFECAEVPAHGHSGLKWSGIHFPRRARRRAGCVERARLPAGARLVDDGDRARTGSRRPKQLVPDGVEIRPYRRPGGRAGGLRARNQEAFADDWGFHPISIEQLREFYLKSRGFDPALWLRRVGRRARSPASRPTSPSATAIQARLGRHARRAARLAPPRASARRCCGAPSPRSTRGPRASGSVSTPRT